MNKNKILAIAMAGAMMTGTLATAVPVFAAENSTTTVSLDVEPPKNTYTMTVPANTTLNSDGTAKELTNGIHRNLLLQRQQVPMEQMVR